MLHAPARPVADLRLRVLVWLLASCVTALFAHAAIGAASGVGLGGHDYAQRDHAAIAPVAFAAAILAATALLAFVVRALSRTGSGDPILALAGPVARSHPATLAIAVAAGGFALLLGMEGSEQIANSGRLEGIVDALGGSVAIGLTAVACAAAFVTFALVRFAASIVAAAVTIARAVVALVVFASRRARGTAFAVRRVDRRRHVSAPAFLAHATGLRAPPLPHTA